MQSTTYEKILTSIEDSKILYQKLILLVGKSGSGKTGILNKIHTDLNVPLINVNLELSFRLLDLPIKKRSSKLSKIFFEIVNDIQSDTILIDNIEILFDKSLQQNPLSLLQNVSKNTVIVSSWNGDIEDGKLVYAIPEHQEYWAYQVENVGTIIDINPYQS